MQTPAALRGKDTAGRVFFDRAEAISIDSFGARIRTRFRLKVGSMVGVDLPTEEGQKQMRVVWSGEEGSVYEGIIGLEFADTEEGWSPSTFRAR